MGHGSCDIIFNNKYMVTCRSLLAIKKKRNHPIEVIYEVLERKKKKNCKIYPAAKAILMQYIMCIEFYCIKYAMHCILCIVFSASYSMLCTLCIVSYALCYMHCFICILFFYYIQCIVFYALFSQHCIQCIVLYALYSMNCILFYAF